MINLTDAKTLVVKNFKAQFGGMNVSEETAIEFLNLVMQTAFNGHIQTSKANLAASYKSVVVEFFGINA
jgi:hypothetical protein